ncbi:MAG: isocitrate lyase/phosphoenolpyruvate mutase family protein [Pseudonocardiales bacterium]|nr:MAG: isocitrate lyase/phosphoenolpyruvate mutase family protein [Pseudonocardiales bacterium]
MPNTSASTFAALHHGGGPFVLPNAWDVASAVLLANVGFPAIGTTSLGVTAAAGLPDGAAAGSELTVALARTLVDRVAVPITVDIEGGYSDDPAAVAALAAELAELGVAGVNLEDGRADGTLRSADAHAAIIRAVASAAPQLFVNARTDTYWLHVGGADERLDETTRRLVAYRDAGAAGVFSPGLTDLVDTAIVAERVALPLNVLWRPGVELTALAAAGVARVSTGSALYRHALAAALATADAARTSTQPATPAVDYDDLQRLLEVTKP